MTCIYFLDESDQILEGKRDLVTGLLKQIEASNVIFKQERLFQNQQRSQILSRISEHVLELVKAYRESMRNMQVTIKI